MATLIKDIDIWKKEVNFWEFMSFVMSKYEDIEDREFTNILAQSDSEETSSKKVFDEYFSKRMKWI